MQLYYTFQGCTILSSFIHPPSRGFTDQAHLKLYYRLQRYFSLIICSVETTYRYEAARIDRGIRTKKPGNEKQKPENRKL